MKTAVEYFNDELDDIIKGITKQEWIEIQEAFEQAKEMEKQQIIDALCVGNDVGLLYNCGVYAEEYYNETFKSE